jgi:heptosyltransferase-3
MRRWLFIAARNFGDALINRRLIDAVAASFPEDQIEVLTRPAFQVFFRGRAGVGAVHIAAFPMGTVKDFGVGAAWNLLRLCLRLRRKHYDVTVNTTGDVRETSLGWLAGTCVNAAPVWPKSHPAYPLFRPSGAAFFMRQPLRISAATASIYAAHDEMAIQLGCLPEVVERLAKARPARGDFQRDLVGLHPFTTQECKSWEWPSWIVLTERLLAEGLRVRIFCSAKELPEVQAHMQSVMSMPGVESVAGNMENFFLKLQEVAVLVGLDSFVMHAAFALNVPAVLVNGSSDPRAWGPPGVRVLSNEGNCPRHPCNGHPTCGDGVVPSFICIRGISPLRVFDEVRASLAANPPASVAALPAIRRG